MELSEQEEIVRSVDVTHEMFDKAGINDRAPHRPSYVDFAFTSERNGAIWEAVYPEEQKLKWENDETINSLILEADSFHKCLRLRFVSIPTNRENVGGYHVDKIQSFKVESIKDNDDQITFLGLDRKGKPVSVTINSSGQASSPNQAFS